MTATAPLNGHADRADIPAELIADLTAEVMQRNGRQRGQEIEFSCPNALNHRNGDIHPSASWNQEKGTWYCYSTCKAGGGAFDLAERFGIDTRRYTDSSRTPTTSNGHKVPPIEAFCRERRLIQSQLVENYGVRQTVFDGRPALRFQTDQGDRIKFLDRERPKAKWVNAGATATVYNDDRALAHLRSGQSVLFHVNGEMSVWACDQAGAAAFTTCTGEMAPTVEVIERLRVLIAAADHPVGIAVTFDRDGAGVEASLAALAAYESAGIPAVALRLPDSLPTGGDVDDLHRQVGDRLLETLLSLPEIKINRVEGGINSLFRFSTNSDVTHEPEEDIAPFPVDVLPVAARQLVSIGAESIGAPADMIGTPLIVYAAAAIGNRVSIELKRGFTQRAHLYGAVVARPGSAKSPAQDLARAPLDSLQRDAHDKYLYALSRFEDSLAAWQTAAPKDRGPKPERPIMEHFFTTDATLEALAPMAERSAGIAMSRDEIVSWVKSCDAYRGGKGGDRQMWLSLWAGSPLKIDRKGSDTTYVPEPSISVIGGVQPDMLGELADEDGRQDGLLDRIIWSYPAPKPLAWSEEVVEQRHIDAVTSIFRRLREAPTGTVTLSPAAKAEWVAWFNENTILTEQSSGLSQGMFSKLPNIAARLALILHCLANPENPAAVAVTTTTMNGAITLAEYYRAHGQRVLPHFGVTGSGRGAGVIQRVSRILDAADGAWVRRTEISKGLGRNVPSGQITEALEQLQARGHAETRSHPSGERGGRPVEEWRSLLTEKTKKRTNSALQFAEPFDTVTLEDDDDVPF